MIRLATTLAATALLAGTANAATEITWWHAMGGKLGEVVNTITSDFNASQNACSLNAVYKGSYEETMTAGIASFRAKQSPNIIQIFDAGSATIIAAKGAAYPVAKLMDEHGVTFNKEDYIPGVRYFYADNDGQMIGMPFNSSTPVLYYNKAVLAEAGVEPPKTWEEFETVAATLKDAGYIALSQSHTPWIFSENFQSRHNLPMADKNNGYDGPATKIAYNNEHLRMHFAKLAEWKDKGWFGYYGSKWSDNKVPFEKQEVAMWIGSSGSFGGLKDTTDFEFGSSTLPYWTSIVGDGEPYHTFIGGAALFAFNGHPEEENGCVAQFFAHLTKPETQFFWHKETGYVPITTAAYDLARSEGYYDAEPDAEVGITQLSGRTAEWNKGYRLGFYVQIREVLNREYDKLFAGDQSVEETFSAIETESDQLLERFAKTAGM